MHVAIAYLDASEEKDPRIYDENEGIKKTKDDLGRAHLSSRKHTLHAADRSSLRLAGRQ
jgi:hypothetical protein